MGLMHCGICEWSQLNTWYMSWYFLKYILAHCGHVMTQILVNIGLGNGLLPNRCQVITRTSADLLSKRQQFCLGLDGLYSAVGCIQVCGSFIGKGLEILQSSTKLSMYIYIHMWGLICFLAPYLIAVHLNSSDARLILYVPAYLVSTMPADALVTSVTRASANMVSAI